MSLKVGDPAPDFELPGTGGKSYKLSDYRGKKVVLAFYPGDETPVCTKQLCAYRDSYSDFMAAGAEVLGISAQSVDSHDKFSEHHGFPFPLLADPGKTVIAAWGAKGPFGMTRRAVFLIGEDGTIIWKHVSATGLNYRTSAELLQHLH